MPSSSLSNPDPGSGLRPGSGSAAAAAGPGPAPRSAPTGSTVVTESGCRGRVLVVAGTHGNEINAPWLLDHWRRQPERWQCGGLALELVIGNPAARAAGRRYLDRDLNRSFDPALLAAADAGPAEVQRARQLLARHGPSGAEPCLVALDLHSTTAAMGNSLVVYGRRPADLALAAALQAQLGLPVYLHEADARETGYLVERWPCGLVIEVGPVPQALLQPAIVTQTRIALETALFCLASAASGRLRLPERLVVHRHLGSLDLPRQADGSAAALLHPRRQGRDWQPLRPGEPLFVDADGRSRPYVPPAGLEGRTVWPVFLNEAAYGEKGIALSLTEREVWECSSLWGEALARLAVRLLPAGS
ncbi:MAG: aspartoacylase [Synechococcus sp.]|nr:aspartoacylase [Synechococcus sp.]